MNSFLRGGFSLYTRESKAVCRVVDLEALPIREHWGCLDYKEALERQEAYVEEILTYKRGEVIVLCSHYPVVTLGARAGGQGELGQWNGPVYQTRRGGRATYHYPGQVICYPLLNLKQRGKNIAGLIDALERATVATLAHYSLISTGSYIRGTRGDGRLTGVWVGEKKIASIGLALRRWISYHGLAFNFNRDNDLFGGITPCGLNAGIMTSLEDLLKKVPSRRAFEECFYQNLISFLP